MTQMERRDRLLINCSFQECLKFFAMRVFFLLAVIVNFVSRFSRRFTQMNVLIIYNFTTMQTEVVTKNDKLIAIYNNYSNTRLVEFMNVEHDVYRIYYIVMLRQK